MHPYFGCGLYCRGRTCAVCGQRGNSPDGDGQKDCREDSALSCGWCDATAWHWQYAKCIGRTDRSIRYQGFGDAHGALFGCVPEYVQGGKAYE